MTDAELTYPASASMNSSISVCLVKQAYVGYEHEKFLAFLRRCSDPNNESDPSSEYSLLGLTHVMNHCLGQKFITWVKINCLDLSLKPGTGIPRPRTVDQSLKILLEMQHTQIGFHAFKMADKIARKEGHRQKCS